MQLKMKDLMQKSKESKSTILYYIKEGLLPEPSKPKPNVHLYDERCIQIIRFIKYLQHNFSYSIAEIKAIFDENNFDFDSSFEMMINSMALISGGRDGEWYTRDELIRLCSLSDDKLIEYTESGYVFERARGFSSKELEIVKILKKAELLGLDFSLHSSYVQSARILAKQEFEIGAKLLQSDDNLHNTQYELLFDLILTLKPYIFNMHTVSEHQNRFTDDSNPKESRRNHTLR